MNVTELAIRRPTAIIMLVILLLGLGVIGYMNLGVDLLPSGNTPIISITTTYPGAGAQEIEKDVVKPIEDSVAGLSGLDRIRSYAGDGYCYTILQFKMSVDTNTAVIDVQKALEGVSGKLPEDASRPVMRKFDVNQDPVLIMSVSGTGSYEELYNEADRIKRSVEKLQGVGNVSLQGVMKKELDIKVDKSLLEYYGVSLNTILAVLQAENINIPAGKVKQDTRDQTVRVLGEFQNENEIKDLHIPLAGGSSLRLAELADVSLRYPDESQKVRLDNKASISISVQKQNDANIVETADIVKSEVDKIRPTLPQGFNLVIASDSTTFINSSLSETKRNLVEGIITTSIVLFLFLRRWRSSLIVLIAIPTSVVATFFMMYVLGFTFNIVSLLGLTVCIGILVDDSVVVLENIHRHIQLGEDPRTAAIRGRMEIGMAAVAITLCDVVVFAPVAFMKDMVGQFFRQFGLTVVSATLFSLFISFTLTPMLSYFMYRGQSAGKIMFPSGPKEGKTGRFNSFFEGTVKKSYRNFLIWALNNRWKIVAIVVAGMAASIMLIPLKVIETEFMPSFDQSKLLININLNPGANLKQADEKAKTVEAHLHEIPEVKDFLTTVGTDDSSNSASIIVRLTDKGKRSKSQNTLAKEIRTWGKTLTGVDFSVTEQNIVARTSIDGTKPVIINISGPNADTLGEVAKKAEDIVRSVNGVVDVDNTNSAGQSEISLKVNRLAAANYGISTYDMASALRTAIEGTKAGVFRKNGNDYDIVVQFEDGQIKTPYDVGSIRLTGRTGQQVTLNQIAYIYLSDSPKEILRLDRQQAVTISANMQGRVLGSINNEIREKLGKLQLPYGYEIKFGGDQENMSTSFDSLIKALAASILLVYMILVVLYESFLTPFIRMLSLPCGIIGAFAALALTGRSLNIMSLIGLIMLDGLASKNGTLLIDYTNTLMKKGLSLREALAEAGMTRLRPILMTSVTMIVGMCPILFSLGDGSEVKAGMAIVLIGGMITSTLLSPVLLPVVYTLMDDLKQRLDRRRNRGNVQGVGQENAIEG